MDNAPPPESLALRLSPCRSYFVVPSQVAIECFPAQAEGPLLSLRPLPKFDSGRSG
ncbi:uncharacterized protein SCHCODRAFT_02605991 [Schizophyllum commune H4-8]|uniref:uncharacterized protein n=1 Tax=Schizophyllum commune (strain H4-8 / FGSC 9210) TaxID=578458 RepID=UPI00215FDD92|nr:uncharacterized protein SCHCODRAFT_02605991 [Schizophyllum commune H4-8]KAI5899742.1 hypothetical protein SCHCODRAFT_02605991 [Schizophyllum commune H4-8]